MYRVAVFDDEAIVIEGIRTIIQREKLDCEIVGYAYDGIEALRVIEETRPDVILTDIRMPGMDGLSLIEESQKILPDAAYVIISGYTEFEYARRALILNALNYIDKPITLKKVVDLFAQLDARRKRTPDAAVNPVREEVDRMVEAIIERNAAGVKESAGKLSELFESRLTDFEQYKHELFKTYAMAVEIVNERHVCGEMTFRISYSEMSQWKTREEVDGYLSRLVGQIVGNMQKTGGGSTHRIVKQVLQYLEENYSRNVGLNEAADMVGVSPAYLSILFKEEVGVSFVKYITDIRIGKAKELLDSGYRVGEVSDMVGYSNYRYFCDIFKRHEGKTPNEYKGCTRKKGKDEE